MVVILMEKEPLARYLKPSVSKQASTFSNERCGIPPDLHFANAGARLTHGVTLPNAETQRKFGRVAHAQLLLPKHHWSTAQELFGMLAAATMLHGIASWQRTCQFGADHCFLPEQAVRSTRLNEASSARLLRRFCWTSLVVAFIPSAAACTACIHRRAKP